MNNNPYFMNAYSQQANIDRINNQMNELEKMKQQIQQSMQPPANINQTFQLAPQTTTNMRYANSLEEVQRDMVISDTPYFSKDMSVLWIKNSKGEIKSYELTEIIPKDEKDLQIEFLQSQIEDLRKEMKNHEQFNTNDDETSTSKIDGAVGRTTKKSEPSSIQDVSKCKTK